MTTQQPKISVKGLRKAFGSKHVLNGVDFDLAVGESLVIIGGSGTGKSVTLKCLLGLLAADAGSILIDGQEMVGASKATWREAMEQFGMLFQGGALFDSLTVWENVAFGLMQGRRHMPRRVARDVAVEKLALVGLGADIAALSPAELSGGMQKRVALARAIATDPKVIFFDEPTTGLDPIMSDVINDLIKRCVTHLGASALSITHDMASARKIANRIAMIYQGRIIWMGNVDQIDHAENPYVDQFIHGRAIGPIQMQIKRP